MASLAIYEDTAKYSSASEFALEVGISKAHQDFDFTEGS